MFTEHPQLILIYSLVWNPLANPTNLFTFQIRKLKPRESWYHAQGNQPAGSRARPRTQGLQYGTPAITSYIPHCILNEGSFSPTELIDMHHIHPSLVQTFQLNSAQLHKVLLDTCSELHTILAARNSPVNKTNKHSCPSRAENAAGKNHLSKYNQLSERTEVSQKQFNFLITASTNLLHLPIPWKS